MSAFTTSTFVTHTPAAMFDLVADVEQYPEFVPQCSSLTVRSRREDEAGEAQMLVTDMVVAYKALRETITCKVRLERSKLTIRSTQISGPFKALDNRWVFRSATGNDGTDGCEIDFFLDYELKNRLLGVFIRSFFDRFFYRYEQAFVARADALSQQRTPLQRVMF